MRLICTSKRNCRSDFEETATGVKGDFYALIFGGLEAAKGVKGILCSDFGPLMTKML